MMWRRLVQIDFSEREAGKKNFYGTVAKPIFTPKISAAMILIFEGNHLFGLQNEELIWSALLDMAVEWKSSKMKGTIWQALNNFCAIALPRSGSLKNGKYGPF